MDRGKKQPKKGRSKQYGNDTTDFTPRPSASFSTNQYFEANEQRGICQPMKAAATHDVEMHQLIEENQRLSAEIDRLKKQLDSLLSVDDESTEDPVRVVYENTLRQHNEMLHIKELVIQQNSKIRELKRLADEGVCSRCARRMIMSDSLDNVRMAVSVQCTESSTVDETRQVLMNDGKVIKVTSVNGMIPESSSSFGSDPQYLTDSHNASSDAAAWRSDSRVLDGAFGWRSETSVQEFTLTPREDDELDVMFALEAQGGASAGQQHRRMCPVCGMANFTSDVDLQRHANEHFAEDTIG